MGHLVHFSCDRCGKLGDPPGEMQPLGWVSIRIQTVTHHLSAHHILLCDACKTKPIPADAMERLEREAGPDGVGVAIINPKPVTAESE